MTIHYHGTPITPLSVLETLAGACFCVSFANPQQVARVHKIGQSVMLDNGAYTAWSSGESPDWGKYYDWAMPWLDCGTTWAVLPDVIAGDWRDTAKLISASPYELRSNPHKASPVWHLHDPIERLLDLADWWPRVCFGSSEQYAVVGSVAWHGRVSDAFDALSRRHGWTMVHMLRGMKCSSMVYPFASVDSTDVARNHHIPSNNAVEMRNRWDSTQCPPRWRVQPKQESLWPSEFLGASDSAPATN